MYCQFTASPLCDIPVHDNVHPLAVLVWFTPNFPPMYEVVTYYVFRADLTWAYLLDKFQTPARVGQREEHNNDRELRLREIIQQDDGEQHETRSYIIRIVRLLQSLKGEPTRRGVPLTVNASKRIISERPILVLSSRLNRVLPSGSFPSRSHQQVCPM